MPNTWPGVRAPSLFLENGTALFDQFNKGFTLLRFEDVEVGSLERAAEERGVPIEIVDIRNSHVARIYEKRLVLLRPDQHVAWRGDECPDNPFRVIDRVRGDLMSLD